MSHETRPATLEDADAMLPLLRPVEVDECIAATGMQLDFVLRQAVKDSAEAWVTFINGELACLWGVVDLCPSDMAAGMGCGWLLTTRAVEKYPKTFWVLSRRYLAELLERWPLLMNQMDVRHEQALRWGKRLGFAFGEVRPLGPYQRPFRHFTITQENLACAHQPSR